MTSSFSVDPETKGYQIYLKDKPVLVEPSTYYGLLSEALDRMRCLEIEQPELGQLEVRQAP